MLDEQDILFGNIAVDLCLISPNRLESALNELEQSVDPSRRIGDFLVEHGILTQDNIAEIIKEQKQRQASHIEENKPALAADVVNPKVAQSLFEINSLLEKARDMGASDLHFTSGCKPYIRRFKQIEFLPDHRVLSNEDTETMILSCITEKQKRSLYKNKSIHFCYTSGHGKRYRACFFRQSNGWDGVFHVIPDQIRDFGENKFQHVLKELSSYPNGIVIISGPSGSGKSSTMNTIIDYVNKSRSDHIITIEDPIEYIHKPEKCQITFREVGSHTQSYFAALKAALRQDPDVIVVGEIKDMETMDAALAASETGHLVLCTLDTKSAAQTISVILDFFPADQLESKRHILSETLRGIICQELIPTIDGKLALATEILVNDLSVANIIKRNQINQLTTTIQIGKKRGMILMDESLVDLYNEALITRDTMLKHGTEDLKKTLEGKEKKQKELENA